MKIQDYDKILGICANHGWEELGGKIGRVYVESFLPRMRVLDPKTEGGIEDAWREIEEASKKSGRTAYNRGLVECIGLSVGFNNQGESDIGVVLGLTDYKHYHSLRVIGPDKRIWVIGTAGITYFRDSSGEINYIFATRDERASNIGGTLETVPSGYMDSELFDGLNIIDDPRLPLERNIKKEFGEEVGLESSKIIGMQNLGLIRIGDFKPGNGEIRRFNDVSATYAVDIGLSSREEVEEGFSRSKQYGEHSKVYVVPESGLAEFLGENSGRLTPRTKAHMIQYLRSR